MQKHWDDEAAAPSCCRFAERLEGLEDWTAEAIHDLFKPFCDEEGIKMGKLGMLCASLSAVRQKPQASMPYWL